MSTSLLRPYALQVKFERWIAAEYESATANRYRIAVELFLSRNRHITDIQFFGLAEVERFVRWRLKNGIAANTINTEIASIRCFFQFCKKLLGEQAIILDPTRRFERLNNESAPAPVSSPQSITALLELWEGHLGATYTPSSALRYKKAIKRLLRNYPDITDPAAFTPEHISAFVAGQLGKGVSVATVNADVSMIRKFFDFAQKRLRHITPVLNPTRQQRYLA